MNKRLIIAMTLMGAAALVSGCNLPSGRPTPTATLSELEIVQTSAAITLTAQDDSGSTNTQPTATSTPSAPTATLAPSSTPFPTATATQSIPCDRAAFVVDVTVPDGTEFTPGETFTKTWRLSNSGSCTWTSAYKLVFSSGDSMGGPASQQLTNGTVAPNQTVDISVELTAPNDPGTYKGNWKLENAQGQEFALRDSNSPFFVEIVVADPVSFTLAFDNVHDCTGGYATVKITNTGTVFLQSAQMQVEDIDDNVSLYGPLSSNNPFVTTPNGCPPGNSDADPGETYYIAVYIGAAPVSGNTAEFTLTLCTDDDLGGTCVTQKVQFEIP